MDESQRSKATIPLDAYQFGQSLPVSRMRAVSACADQGGLGLRDLHGAISRTFTVLS
jgi:hypothetical protein